MLEVEGPTLLVQREQRAREGELPSHRQHREARGRGGPSRGGADAAEVLGGVAREVEEAEVLEAREVEAPHLRRKVGVMRRQKVSQGKDQIGEAYGGRREGGERGADAGLKGRARAHRAVRRDQHHRALGARGGRIGLGRAEGLERRCALRRSAMPSRGVGILF